MAADQFAGSRPAASASSIVLAVPPRTIALGAVVVAGAVGAMLTRSPALGLGLMAAVFFVPLALTNLSLAITLWVPLAAVQYAQIAGPAPFGAALVIVGAFAGNRLLGPSRERSPSLGFWARGLGAFLLWIAMSALWAQDFGATLGRLPEYLVVGAVLTVLATTLARPRYVALVGLAFVCGTVLAVLVGLFDVAGATSTTADAIDTATQKRLSGGAGDPNYLAAMLVPAVTIAIALLSWYRDQVVRLGLLACVIVMLYGLILTESRGGFVAALAALVMSVVLARGRRMAMVAGAMATITVAGAFFAVSPGALSRITSLDDGGAGRSDLWTVAYRMVEDNPVQGVGLGNFVVRSRDYALLRPGSLEYSELIVDKPYVTHNFYLQTLAEVGIVGLALLLVVLVSCVRSGLLASRRFERLGEPAMATLARAVAVGTTASLIASVFISNTTDVRLFTLLALGPALLTASTRLAASNQRADSTSR